jgi:hypothetical protein
MYAFTKKLALFSSILFIVSCSSKEVAPEPIPVQPKSLTIVTYNEVNPTNISYTWKDNLLISYTVKTLNTATNKDFARKYDITRDDKKLITSILYTYEGGGFPDGNTTQTYTYNAEKTQVNYLSTNWTYNKAGNLTNLNYGSRSISGFIEYSYDNANLLTKLYWKEGSYLENTNTLNSFTSIENPLFNIAKSLQFLNITYNNADLTMTSTMFLPKSYNNGAIDNFVTYDLDTQNRVNSITVSNNGIVLKKYSFTY